MCFVCNFLPDHTRVLVVMRYNGFACTRTDYITPRNHADKGRAHIPQGLVLVVFAQRSLIHNIIMKEIICLPLIHLSFRSDHEIHI